MEREGENESDNANMDNEKTTTRAATNECNGKRVFKIMHSFLVGAARCKMHFTKKNNSVKSFGDKLDLLFMVGGVSNNRFVGGKTSSDTRSNQLN